MAQGAQQQKRPPPPPRPKITVQSFQSLLSGENVVAAICDFSNHTLEVTTSGCVTPIGLAGDVSVFYNYAMGIDLVTGNTLCIEGTANLGYGHRIRLVTVPIVALSIIIGCMKASGQSDPVPTEAYQVYD